MAQYTNLNVSPYFDDFDPEKNYHKVLFKPGYPVQARELTTLQSILQNQIEKFGRHFFKEGEKIIPGGTTYFKNFDCVLIESSFAGVSVGDYIRELEKNKVIIVGENSGVTARVEKILLNTQSEKNSYTLYVSYIDSNSGNNSSKTFLDGEQLITTSPLPYQSFAITPNTPFARTISLDSTQTGSAFGLSKGVYFIRGNFVEVSDELILLTQYNNNPSCRVGFYVNEELITTEQDFSLNDNARGFTNYAAPGADRFKITCKLGAKDLNNFNDEDFVEIATVVDGTLRLENNNENEEVAENYYIKPFNVTVNESLNDEVSNNGIFAENRLTYNGNTPSENLLTYKISPGKYVINGQIVDNLDTVYLDAPKPRKTKSLLNQKINYFTGPTLTVNRFSGTPLVGFNTDYVLRMQSERVGFSTLFTSGHEIGVCRIYDFKLRDDSYKSPAESNQFDISLYDIQLFTYIQLNENITINSSVYVKGKNSGASGFIKESVSDSNTLILYQVSGEFKIGEKLTFNDEEIPSRVITSIDSKSIENVKSLYGDSGSGNIFTADILQVDNYRLGNISISTESPATVPPTSASGITITPTSTTIGTALTAPLSMVGVVTASDFNPNVASLLSTATAHTVSSTTIGIGTTVPLAMVGIVTALGFSTYTAAANVSPQVSWTPPTLPVGFSTRSFTLMFEDLSTGNIHWHVQGISSTGPYSIGAGSTIIPGATIKRNYIMNADGTSGVGSITPSLIAIGPEYIAGLTTTGYSGPQPPIGDNHVYRLSLTTLLNESPSAITTSLRLEFGVPAPAPIVPPSPTYSVTPSAASVDEGSSVTFNVNTTNVANGTTLYWTIPLSGNLVAGDFTTGISGSFVINANSSTVTTTLSADNTTEGAESFQLQIRTGSTTGTVVATSTAVTINDTSTTPVPLTITLSSSSFTNNSNITSNYRYDQGNCAGLNRSPQLSWTTTGSIASVATWRLRCIDISAGNFIHWSVSNIPVGTTSIAENGSWPGGTTVNLTDWDPDPVRANGWGGPCPQSGTGTHQYEFTITAHDAGGTLLATSNTYIGTVVGYA